MRSYRVIPSALFSVTLLHLVSVTTAIKCFTCNEEKNISCPGWDRSDIRYFGFTTVLVMMIYLIN